MDLNQLPSFPSIWRADIARLGRRVHMQTLLVAAGREHDEANTARLLDLLAPRYAPPLGAALSALAAAWRAYEQAIGWDGTDSTSAAAAAGRACWRFRVQAMAAAQAL